MKKYLDCQVTRNDGTTFSNPLMLSEAHFISQIVQSNESVTVTLATTTNEGFKSIFG